MATFIVNLCAHQRPWRAFKLQNAELAWRFPVSIDLGDDLLASVTTLRDRSTMPLIARWQSDMLIKVRTPTRAPRFYAQDIQCNPSAGYGTLFS
jgi:hypothetical protein